MFRSPCPFMARRNFALLVLFSDFLLQLFAPLFDNVAASEPKEGFPGALRPSALAELQVLFLLLLIDIMKCVLLIDLADLAHAPLISHFLISELLVNVVSFSHLFLQLQVARLHRPISYQLQVLLKQLTRGDVLLKHDPFAELLCFIPRTRLDGFRWARVTIAVQLGSASELQLLVTRIWIACMLVLSHVLRALAQSQLRGQYCQFLVVGRSSRRLLRGDGLGTTECLCSGWVAVRLSELQFLILLERDFLCLTNEPAQLQVHPNKSAFFTLRF